MEKDLFDGLQYPEFYDPSIMSLDGVFISGGEDVIIPVKHFHLFPWDKFNIKDSNISSLSAGGSPLRDYEWTICFWLMNDKGEFHPYLKQYRWCIPESLVDFIKWSKDNAISDLQYKLRKLLGI